MRLEIDILSRLARRHFLLTALTSAGFFLRLSLTPTLRLAGCSGVFLLSFLASRCAGVISRARWFGPIGPRLTRSAVARALSAFATQERLQNLRRLKKNKASSPPFFREFRSIFFLQKAQNFSGVVLCGRATG